METPETYKGLVDVVLNLINLLIPAIFAVLFIYFVWKIIDAWILNAGDEQKRADGRRLVLIAVLMFVLMLSTWGIVAMIRNSIFG